MPSNIQKIPSSSQIQLCADFLHLLLNFDVFSIWLFCHCRKIQSSIFCFCRLQITNTKQQIEQQKWHESKFAEEERVFCGKVDHVRYGTEKRFCGNVECSCKYIDLKPTGAKINELIFQSDSDQEPMNSRGGVMRPTISSQNKQNGAPKYINPR